MTSFAAGQSTAERRASLRKTSVGVLAAHDAFLQRSIGRARWERRGFLRRLVRIG